MKSSISYTTSNPFGMPMPGRQYISALASKRFGYQGQFAEKDEETGYNNFYFRDYDAEVGRFLTFDPYNQYHSPYVGMGNNPVSMIDPTGGLAGGGWACGIVCPGGSAATGISKFAVDIAIGIGTGAAQGGVNALNGGEVNYGQITSKLDGLEMQNNEPYITYNKEHNDFDDFMNEMENHSIRTGANERVGVKYENKITKQIIYNIHETKDNTPGRSAVSLTTNPNWVVKKIYHTHQPGYLLTHSDADHELRNMPNVNGIPLYIIKGKNYLQFDNSVNFIGKEVKYDALR